MTAHAQQAARAAPKKYRAMVLGLGNVLCGDDGVGVVAVHRLWRQYEVPEDLSIVDGGTLGLSLLPHIADTEQLLILDAVNAPAAPGSLVRLEGDDVGPAVRERLSVHQVGVADLLTGAHWLGRYPRRVVLLGVVPQSIELQLGRSSVVEAQLAALVRAARVELERFGIPLLVARCGSMADRPSPDERSSEALGL